MWFWRLLRARGRRQGFRRALLPLVSREIVVLEPRRMAAGWPLAVWRRRLGNGGGGAAGYQVRFEDVAGPRTRLRFLTEGVLTRHLSDPHLKRIVSGFAGRIS